MMHSKFSSQWKLAGPSIPVPAQSTHRLGRKETGADEALTPLLMVYKNISDFVCQGKSLF
jgi:hypothetical protein